MNSPKINQAQQNQARLALYSYGRDYKHGRVVVDVWSEWAVYLLSSGAVAAGNDELYYASLAELLREEKNNMGADLDYQDVILSAAGFFPFRTA